MMIETALLLGLMAQPLDTDLLVSRGGNAKVILVVDESCSMNEAAPAQACGGGTVNRKRTQLQAALRGCLGPEGILDRWAPRAEMAILGFGGGNGIRLLQDFTHNVGALETAVASIAASGGTPLSQAIRTSGRHMQNTWGSSPVPSRAQECDDHYLVALSDGRPNGGSATMDYACDTGVPNVNVPAGSPELASQYLYNNGDMLCDLTGEQPISTYTIGLGDGANFDEAQLTAMAAGGEYFYASDLNSLSTAFDTILQEIVERGSVTFGTSAFTNDGFFSGNDVFISAFKPNDTGAWVGNLKKACVLPLDMNGDLDSSITDCWFLWDDVAEELRQNPDAVDQWSASLPAAEQRLDQAMVGGAGQRILTSNFGDADPEDPVAFSDYYTRRNLYTWEPGGTDYIRLTPADVPTTLTGVGGCNHHRMIALMHGYDVNSFDCGSLQPLDHAEWPMGAVVNSGSALLAYGDDCNNPGECLVAVGTNHGLISFIDAASGDEVVSMVPGDLWRSGMVTPRPMADILNQPNTDYRRMPTVDGEMRLFHLDDDGDAVIDSTEEAYLIVGLGHGGSAFYFIDVTNPIDATPDATDNPVIPLVRTNGASCAPGEACWLDDLRSTQAAPVVGIGRFPGSPDRRTYAAFTSGGDWEAAEASHPYPNFAGAYTAVPGTSSTVPCATLLSAATLGLGSSLCDAWNPLGSYDDIPWPGGISPFDQPWTVIVNGAEQVTGITFDEVELEPGDSIRITDMSNNNLLVLTSADNGSNVSRAFSTGDQTASGDAMFRLRIDTDGAPTAPIGRGVQIRDFDVVRRGSSVSTGHRPFLAVVDLERINGASPRPFAATTETGAELLLVTRDCSGSGVAAGRCLDRTTAPILDRMICPISAAPAVYSEGGIARAFYFGDWCGQLWKVSTDDQGATWGATMILDVNEDLDPLNPPPGLVSQNVRRFERAVDLFVTGCKGNRSVGVSFGTGNLNRSGADDDLVGAAVATSQHPGFDVVGTIFDDGITTTIRLNESNSPTNTCAGDCLTDVTQLSGSDRGADNSLNDYRGFFWRLRDQERMLRDPLTVDAVTFFSTFQVTQAATACDAGVGTDRTYAVRNCDGEPVAAPGDGVGTGGTTLQNDRTVVENTNSVIGAGLSVFTPADGAPIVTTNVEDPNQNANLLPGQNQQGFRMLYWYQPEEG